MNSSKTIFNILILLFGVILLTSISTNKTFAQDEPGFIADKKPDYLYTGGGLHGLSSGLITLNYNNGLMWNFTDKIDLGVNLGFRAQGSYFMSVYTGPVFRYWLVKSNFSPYTELTAGLKKEWSEYRSFYGHEYKNNYWGLLGKLSVGVKYKNTKRKWGIGMKYSWVITNYKSVAYEYQGTSPFDPVTQKNISGLTNHSMLQFIVSYYFKTNN